MTRLRQLLTKASFASGADRQAAIDCVDKMEQAMTWLRERRFVRPFVWLVICITAVGIHHTWFDIGSRGALMAFTDGAMLCLLSVAMHWLHSIIMRPNAQVEFPEGSDLSNNGKEG